MGVNGGAGNAISLSEIQSYYGGSNPISVSEYNRGGSFVPSSGTDTGTVSASLSGGNTDWQRGENTAHANQQEVTITIPANTVISTTQNWSWSITNAVYSNWGNHSNQDDGPDSYGTLNCNKTLTWFGTTISQNGGGLTSSSFTQGGQSKLCNFTDRWSLMWYVSAGSGISVSNSGGYIYNVNYSGYTRGDHFPNSIRGGNQGTYRMVAPAAPNSYQGATYTVPSNQNTGASGSITISGTSGSSGCTIKMCMAIPYNDPAYSAWMPALAAFTGTQSTTGNRNTNIPTTIGVGNSCNLDLFNAPGTPAP